MATNSKSPNPESNPIIQALLDLDSANMGHLTIKDALTKLKNDKKLRQDLGRTFTNRGYGNTTFTRLTTDYRLYERLSPAATHVLGLLGEYCAEDGLFAMSIGDICEASGIASKKTVHKALSELCEAHVLVMRDGAKQHEPPIYQVSPAVMHSGPARHLSRDLHNFREALPPGKGILDEDPVFDIKRDKILRELPDGSKIYFYMLTLVPAEKKDSDAATTSEPTNKADK